MCCAAVWGAVLHCVVLCCALLCCAVPWVSRTLGSAWGGAGAGQTGGFAVWVAGSGHVVGWRLVGVVWLAVARCVGAAGGLNDCCLVRWVRWVSVGLPSLGPVPSVGTRLYGCIGVHGLEWCSLLVFAGSPPRLSPCLCSIPPRWYLGRVPFSSIAGALVSVWWPLRSKVAGVVAWRLGCGGRFSVVPCVGATWCGSCAVGSGLRWCVVVGVCLWAGLSCVPVSRSRVWCLLGVSHCRLGLGGRGGVGLSGVVFVPPPPVLASSPFRIGVARALSCSQCWWPSGDSQPPCCVARSALFLWVRARHLVPPPALLPRTFPFALSLPGALVAGWWRGLWDADRPRPGSGCLEPSAEGFGRVGGAKEGSPCP